MSGFRFDFGKAAGDASNVTVESKGGDAAPAAPVEVIPGKQVVISAAACQRCSLYKVGDAESVRIGDAKFYKCRSLDPADLPSDSSNSSLRKVARACDVVPSVYEGGFKLWECALDLIAFLQSKQIVLKGSSVADIGCGHGLPGISALQQGAAHVAFQDLNEEVLLYATCTNILLNTDVKSETLCTQNDATNRVTFFAGDWSSPSLVDSMQAAHYDFIFTSDTLYSLASMSQLLELLLVLLKPETGVAYVAAKRYYFGVGGSTAAFLDLCKRRGGVACKMVHTVVDGQSNIREIFEVKTAPMH